MKKLYKLVFVVGNGFDMDLKLDTSYKSFINSQSFMTYVQPDQVRALTQTAMQFQNTILSSRTHFLSFSHPINVFNVLKAKSSLENWYDIERQLAIIAHNRINSIEAMKNGERFLNLVPIDESSFHHLHDALWHYLSNLPFDSIYRDSIAYKLFTILNKFPDLVQVKSFNYTDFNQIFSGTNQLTVDYIHGNLKEKSLIIGIQDDIEIHPGYNYMIKSFSEHFRSHSLIYDLEDADEVIFFGHSLGEVDYHYFRDFFQKQTAKSTVKRNLRLSIFTYDHKSRINLLQQLRNMNQKKTDMLFALCDFQIFMTDKNCKDSHRIDMFLQDLDYRLTSCYM